MACEFDVFLCHNSKDKPTVRRLATLLSERGVRPWLDENELRPGVPWQAEVESIAGSINAAAVLVDSEGIGPWQSVELRALLEEFVRRKVPVIPVLLPP